jgi:hypothetical protein
MKDWLSPPDVATLASLERERDEAKRTLQMEWDKFANLVESVWKDRAEAAERERDEAIAAWDIENEKRHDAEEKLAALMPMLTLALSNLQALMEEMRQRAHEHARYQNVPCQCDSSWHVQEIQCWVDKLGTVLADLQEVKPR